MTHAPRTRHAALVASLMLALFGFATAPPASAAFSFIRSFGAGTGMGSAPGELSTPQGIGLAPRSGDLYVADNQNDRVQEFFPGGKFRRLFGSTGPGNGQFQGPLGLGVSRTGQIYVSDGAKRVQQFSPTRTFVRSFGAFTSTPTNLAVAPNGDVYVTDGSLIDHYTGTGGLVGSFGGTGSGDGQFGSTIGGLTVAPNGHVYAGDYSGARVEEFTANGTFVRSLANSGQAAVLGPIGVAVTRAGEIFISDNGHERAIELRPNGSFVREFGNAGPGKLDNPGQATVDCAGNAYVADLERGRVNVYGNPAAPRPPCRPAVSKFRISPAQIQKGHGATFRYRLNEAATVRIVIDGAHALPNHKGTAGPNAQSFSGKVNGHFLKRGDHAATITAKANGLKSKPRHLTFKVV